MINIRAKIEKSIRQRGIKATLRMSLYNLIYYGRKLTPRSVYGAYKEREFDRMNGVDTSGRIDLSDLGDVDGVAAELGTRYEPIDPATFHLVMDRVRNAGLDLSSLTFVDYGCGKGRALLLASHYAFDKIVGIEISQTLVETARSNLEVYQATPGTHGRMTVVQADALEWEPPHQPCLFYFYHPFEAELLALVLKRIRRSLEEHPRPAWAVYVGAMEEVLEEADFLRPIAVQRDDHPRHGIYECRTAID